MEGEQTSRDLGRSPARGEKQRFNYFAYSLYFEGRKQNVYWKTERKNLEEKHKKKTLVTCSKSDYKKISYDYKKIS